MKRIKKLRHSGIKVRRIMELTCMMVVFASGTSAWSDVLQIEPAIGAEGTIVRVTTGREEPITAVEFNGGRIAFQGMAPSVFFTVPFREGAPGERIEVEVSIEFNDGTREGRFFYWVAGPRSSSLALNPPHAFRHARDLTSEAVGRFLSLILRGTGFDTSCSVAVDGTEMLTVLPDVSFQFPGSKGDFGKILPGFAIDQQGTALVAILPRAVALSGGDHRVAVTCGQRATEATVHFPRRDLRVEVDRGNCCDWFPANVELESALEALSQGDLVLDVRLDQPVAGCPENACKSPACCINRAGIKRFLTNHSHYSDLFDGQWYLHVGIVGHLYDYVLIEGAYGVLIDFPSRQSVAVFLPAVPEKLRLRTLLHEVGHGLNLTHCEIDAENETIMVPAFRRRGCPPNLTFAGSALAHLQSHPDNEVKPGVGQYAFNTHERCEGKCMDASGGDVSKIKIALDADKHEIQVGESVVLWAKVNLINGQGGFPSSLSADPAYGNVQYFISRPTEHGRETVAYRPVFHFDVESDEEHVTDPIERPVEISFGAGGATFKDPGDYEIVARYSDHASEPLRIHVGEIDPNCAEEDVRTVLRDDVGLFIHLKGGDPGTRVIPLLERVSAHSTCRLSTLANYSLGKYFTEQLSLDSKQAGLAYLRKAEGQIRRLPLEHQFSLYEQLIKITASIGDSKRARLYLDEFESLVASQPAVTNRATEYLRRSREYLGTVSDPP